MTEIRIIGRGNSLPWNLPSDQKEFRKRTMGKPIIMGRKTFQSISSRPLEGRLNIVMTGNESFSAEGVVFVKNFEAALEEAHSYAKKHGVDEIAVIGGAEIYKITLHLAQRLYLTVIKDNSVIEGDKVYPYLRPGDWRKVSHEEIARQGEEAYARVIMTYDRCEFSAI